jgi:creatine kinase/arginine kinase
MGGCGSKDGVSDPKKGKSLPQEMFKSSSELVEFSSFFHESSNSALKRNLTSEIWEEYKDKSDAEGVTFKTMIFSGIKNQDSGIGLYAGSHDSYTTFEKLFDKVVEEYHGHKKDDKHISEMTSEGLTNAEFTAEDAAMVNSTRIRVGRNLKGYPLGPGVSREQRNEIMDKVVEACGKFEGDLKGTFYPLKGMDKAVQQQLIDDHFLFKEGDRFLAACNLNRDWPEGRGIFHNDAKTFLVWVNEEDQLRIISMQQGAGIAEVFDRLCRAATTIEGVAEFARDDHLGYITSCPTNLGTALRASVHIKLPKLMKNKAKFNEIADKYYVQIRGIHGEHTETNDGVFDISNRRRLGRSEKALVQDMIDGVQALIAAEKAEA